MTLRQGLILNSVTDDIAAVKEMGVPAVMMGHGHGGLVENVRGMRVDHKDP